VKRTISMSILLMLASMATYAQRGGAPPASPVSVATVTQETVASRLQLVGTAMAKHRSLVATEVEGIVDARHFDAGQAVNKGDALVTLRGDQLRIRRAAAEAEHANLVSLHADRKAALERSRVLFSKGHVSEEVLQGDAFTEAALQHRVTSAAAEVQRLDDLLQKTAVAVPFDGVMTRVHVEAGEWLAVGDAVGELLDLSRIEIVVDLPENHVREVDVDAKVVVSAETLAGQPREARILALIPDSDEETHMVPLRMEVDNADGALVAGMFVTTLVPLIARRDVRLVPKDAIVSRGEASLLFVVEEGRCRELYVETGMAVRDRVAVNGDIREGQQVVVRGNERLRDGQPVAIDQVIE